jgi:hypothetical protein
LEACSATWNLGTNSAFALEPRKTTENLDRVDWFARWFRQRSLFFFLLKPCDAIFFVIPFYLQSVLVHSANYVKTCIQWHVEECSLALLCKSGLSFNQSFSQNFFRRPNTQFFTSGVTFHFPLVGSPIFHLYKIRWQQNRATSRN